MIWKDNDNDTTLHTFNNFKKHLNSQSKLKWKTQNPSTTTNFLDLTISIDRRGYISTKTFQKPMNLFLYIPSNSSHSPNMRSSLIYGLLRTYYLQNTNRSDFIQLAKKLYQRLLARGHSHETLTKNFNIAANKLSTSIPLPWLYIKQATIKDKTNSQFNMDYIQHKKQNETVIFHMKYTSRDMSTKSIQQHYQSTMANKNTGTTCDVRTYSETPSKEPMNVKTLTIAYSRPKNLFDTLYSSTLHEHESTISEILNSLKAETQG